MKDIKEIIKRKQGRGTKIIQFGEGNFLRGFVDEMVDIANERGCLDAEVIIFKPRSGKAAEAFKDQDCFYTTLLRSGQEIRKRVISCVSAVKSCYDDYSYLMSLAGDETVRFIVSNTTEAGIVYDPQDSFTAEPPVSFPGKITKFLFERYRVFNGDKTKGIILLPVELIDDNGGVLKSCIKKLAEDWKLEEGFLKWVDEACIFCSTLVDRIISGYPKDEAAKICEELGYEDQLIVTGEAFGSWVIQPERSIAKEFPLDKAGLPVLFTEDVKPFKKRKVRLLNGAHTSMVLYAYLKGYNTVGEALSDKNIEAFIREFFEKEAKPTIKLDKKELDGFADSVIERFKNPYIRHELSAIALNSVSKWKTRCLPTLLDNVEMNGTVPKRLAFSLAALLAYYRGEKDADGKYCGYRIVSGEKEKYEIRDGADVTDVFEKASKLTVPTYVDTLMGNTGFWGMDLNTIEGLNGIVKGYIKSIIEDTEKAIELI